MPSVCPQRANGPPLAAGRLGELPSCDDQLTVTGVRPLIGAVVVIVLVACFS